jgi:hypothetical protein
MIQLLIQPIRSILSVSKGPLLDLPLMAGNVVVSDINGTTGKSQNNGWSEGQ